MTSNLPSSFASAAAGQSRDLRGGRGGSGSGEWSRRDGRSANGTLTFRRSSNAPFNNQSQQMSDTTPVQTPATEHPPTLGLPVPTDVTLRYSKEQLLELAKAQVPSVDLASLLVSGWNPGQVNGTPSRGWGKTNDNHVPQDPGVCWDANGQVKPIGLQDFSSEERELFSSDVNSTLKPPQQNKEGAHQGGNVNGRKTSVSHGSNYGMSSPSTASRPGTRRRETGDANPFPGAALASPTATGRFSRDEGPWFGRKSLETKESTFEEPEEEQKPSSAAKPTTGFGNLLRDPTPGGNPGFGSAANLWGSSAGAASSGSGMGGFGSFALPTSTIGDKRVGLTRGESRLAHLLPKDSSENIAAKANESSNTDPNRSWRSRPRTDTDPFAADDSIGGRQDLNSPHQGHAYETPVKGSANDFGMSGLHLGGDAEGSGSPQTNPYRSPPERGDHGAEEAPGDMASLGLGGGQEHMSNLNAISRGFPTAPFDGSDRSQTSSVGAKGFPAINTFGGWPSAVGTGTPDRERSGFGGAFGTSLFSPVGDLQSPGGFGAMNMFGPASTSSIGAGGSMRQSKLGALFPAALQAQMQNQDQDNLSDTASDFRQANPLGAIGRASAGPSRDTNSPLRRGALDDVLSESTRSPGPFGTSGAAQHGLSTTAQPAPFQGSQPAGDSAGQHRSMVMPDRMRWVYLDPQGHIQGPFTGLEMNDWYKANFFTPDLRVKKIEDTEFEPLGQLIRRIGNSREPFLVPQMGIPHGPPASSGQQFPTGDRGVIPPLVGAFPSFGRTLTAEEQNNLERRKQEEQFMMARQREFMAQHPFPKMQIPGTGSGLPGALHHHSSAHSLQSQPSFGSIASPIGPNQPPVGAIGPNPSFFEGQAGTTQPSGAQGNSAEYELTVQEREVLANLQSSGAPNILQQGRSNLPAPDQLSKDTQGFSERLKEFHNLRAARDAAEEAAARNAGMATVNEELNEDPSSGLATEEEIARYLGETTADDLERLSESLSLTQQVQKTQAAAAAAKQQPQPQDVWKQPADLPMPFPPPQQQGSTPIAAPTAQRTRSTLPDQYASRSRSETPESGVAAQPPPLAPWARDPGSENHKGPSLKEIQEAEAKKAAKAEEQAAAARRAALEQEAAAIREREKAGAVVAPGLPTSSTWGNGSPVTTTASSPWTKPAAAKATPVSATAASSAAAKKTLADIQREEEARKQRAAKELASSQAAKDHASQIAAAATTAMGKRYADLASKAQVPATPAAMAAAAGGVAPPPGSGWATVGAGGKVKIPTGPSAQSRSVSTTSVKPAQAPAPVRPAVKQSVSTVGKMDAGSAAMDEFNKWVHRELSRGGITGGIDIDSFAATLQVLPSEHQLIADAVYASSTTMDGRHFAEEYIRRKKLAEKGVVEKQPTPVSGDAKSGGGGWSEVAKKGGAPGAGGQQQQASKEEGMPSGFKVVPGRKKGKK